MSTPKSSKKPVNTVPHTVDDTNPMTSLRAKLKACDPEVQNYVTAFEAENLKLQRQIAKHQAHEITLNNRIKVLEEEQYRPKVEFKIKDLYDDKSQPQERENEK